MNDRRLAILCRDPATRSHDGSVLIIDETVDRKDGTKTAHVAHQYLGSVGRIASGIVSVTSLWAAEDVYYPLHVAPYTPAKRFPKGKDDPTCRTKPQLAVQLVDAAVEVGFSFRAVVADCLYGEHPAVQTALWDGAIPYVMGLRAHRFSWAPADDPHTPEDAARAVPGDGPRAPGGWTAVVRRFRDGYRETWWAADLCLASMAVEQALRLVAVTTDPARLPADSTWYLLTNLPHPDAPHATTSPFPPGRPRRGRAPLRAQGPGREGDKQMKQELGWADWQVRTDRAIRRHWALVCGAFSFCWWAWSRAPGATAWPVGTTTDQPMPVANAGRGKTWPLSALRADRPNVSWTGALRRVQAWLQPWTLLSCWWRALSSLPPPPPLQALLNWLWLGHPIDCFVR